MPAAVEGHCDPRFGPLREAFRANFAERGELGAAVCVMINGHVVALISPASPAIVDSAALDEAVTEQVYGQDLVLHRPSRFGLGFQLTQPERPIGPGQATFGHFDAAGSLGFADPESGVAFGYVMNQMGPRWQNPRTRALVDAVYESLER
jgi:CubicO group peptidase (beta-lactamase class C family)